MTEGQYKDRIAELEHAVNLLNNFWTKERESHDTTMQYVIELQKKLLGIKE